MKKNILIITGTRAEFGLFYSTLEALQKSKTLNFELLVTGMHTLSRYKESLKEIEKSGFPIARIVRISDSGNMLTWFSDEIKGIASYCARSFPDCILILGDRDEALAGAIVGSHLGIPVAHIHGGDVTGQTTVDQLNRDAITQLATYHFAATKKSADRISAMKQDGRVFKVGAPGIDSLKTVKRVSRATVAKKFSLSASQLWMLIIVHPEPLGKRVSFKNQIISVIRAVKEFPAEKIWIYPNSDTGSEVFIRYLNDLARQEKIHLYQHIPRQDFIELLQTVDILIGNSSAGIIESAFFHLPIVNIGCRQSDREHSTNIINAAYNSDQIIKGIHQALSSRFRQKCKIAKQIYGKGNAGGKIVKILEQAL